ncbi:hypothetical protein BGP_3965 [Beggiatoa sp. PS]|nr:hypothetical protein BGP_3965 [Beggiatoa sp. PS]
MEFNKKLKVLGEKLITDFQLAIINYQLSIPSEPSKLRYVIALFPILYSISPKGLNMLKTILILNRYIWLMLIPLLLIWGWLLLADRLETRTHQAMYKQLNSVKQIWGGNLAQPMPSVRYKRFGSDVSTLSKGEIHATDIAVILKVDYRKKGLVYYTGYHAEFTGKYTIKKSRK